MRKLASSLGPGVTLVLLDDADHSWHVPARSSRNNTSIMAEALDALAGFADTLI
jgi:hypothetical protein